MTLFAGALVVALVALGRHARSAELLAPIVVGGLLRLAVMAIAHAGSLHLGDGGLLFLDDRGYFERGELLASAWRAGELIDPAAAEYAGTYQFGYPALMGAVFTLVGHSVLPAKLLNVLAGTTTVLLLGLLSGRVIGECSRKRAAWAAALFPTLVWWSAPLMKEAVTTLLVVAALYAATFIPRRSAVILTTVLLAALFITRSGAALVVGIAIGSALVLAGMHSGNIGRKQWIRAAAGGGAVALVGLSVLSGGDFGALTLQYQSTIQDMIERYQGSNPFAVPLDAGKTLVTPLPWTFDIATRNWDRGLYPGVWALYLAYPLAVFGAWRLRRKPELALLLVPLVLSIVLNAFTSGFPFRQRSVVEPLILILAIAGTASYRQATEWGSLALGAAALVAAVHARSPATGLAVVAGAVALWAISRRLPRETLESPSEESTLVNSIEREPRESSLAGLAEAVRTMRAAAAGRRAESLVLAAPSAAPTAPKAAGQVPDAAFRLLSRVLAAVDEVLARRPTARAGSAHGKIPLTPLIEAARWDLGPAEPTCEPLPRLLAASRLSLRSMRNGARRLVLAAPAAPISPTAAGGRGASRSLHTAAAALREAAPAHRAASVPERSLGARRLVLAAPSAAPMSPTATPRGGLPRGLCTAAAALRQSAPDVAPLRRSRPS